MQNLIFILFALLLSLPMNAQEKIVVTAPIVQKNFMKKNGQATDLVEYYLRQSIQDYFIKFCESQVSRTTLEAYLESQKEELIPTVTLEVEILEGYWDICPEDPVEMQSRIGKYVIIHRIVE